MTEEEKRVEFIRWRKLREEKYKLKEDKLRYLVFELSEEELIETLRRKLDGALEGAVPEQLYDNADSEFYSNTESFIEDIVDLIKLLREKKWEEVCSSASTVE